MRGPPSSSSSPSLSSTLLLRLLLIIAVAHHRVGYAQFPRDSAQYKESIFNAHNGLVDTLLASNQPLNEFVRPDSALIFKDSYIFDYPISTIYVINVIVNPCRNLAPDCCVNVYGTAEYPSLLRNNLETERLLRYPILGNESEVAINYNLIYEDWSLVAPENTRGADDNTVFDSRCVKAGVPYSFCQGLNFAYVRSDYRPACMDYNQTVNADAGCTAPNGTVSSFCVAVAYSQTAFIPQCNGNVDDPHCGTFLEVHRAHGTPYAPENFVISSVRITNRNVSGFNTVMLPLTYNNSANKILCAYTESFVRVGSIVYIRPSAPVCCCPQPFKAATRIGSWQCPVGDSGAGSTAYIPKNLFQTLLMEQKNNAYPFCPNDVHDNEDLMMCSNYDSASRRHFLEPCATVTAMKNAYQVRKYGSSDLYNGVMPGPYDGICPYYVGCALTLDSGKCKLPDIVFSFIGMVGVVTAIDSNNVIPTVMVSFNDGRTSYKFLLADVKLELYRSMFEIWWVVKTPTENVVQKRKGFNITSPTCTLDLVNQRYFPFTVLGTVSATDPTLATPLNTPSLSTPHVYLDGADSFA